MASSGLRLGRPADVEGPLSYDGLRQKDGKASSAYPPYDGWRTHSPPRSAANTPRTPRTPRANAAPGATQFENYAKTDMYFRCPATLVETEVVREPYAVPTSS